MWNCESEKQFPFGSFWLRFRFQFLQNGLKLVKELKSQFLRNQNWLSSGRNSSKNGSKKDQRWNMSIELIPPQDELGQYNFGYSDPNSARTETKTADGVVRGSYNYLDTQGLIQTVHYVADALGFRVAATNLPAAPQGPNSIGKKV